MPSEMPKWLQEIQDEKLRQLIWEKAHKEWVPMADFTQTTQAKAEELRLVQEQLAAQEAENARYMTWYHEKYEPYLARQAAEAEKRAMSPTPSNPASPNGNWYENWDTFTPQQQAQTLYQQQVNYANAIAQQYGKAFQDAQAALNQQIQDQFGVYIDAIERRHKDPTLNVQEFLDKARKFKTADFNPLDAAYKEVTYEKDKEKWLEEGRKLGRQDLETEIKARPSPGPRVGGEPEPFKPGIVKKEDRMAELDRKITEKLGPQVWT